MDCSCSRGLYIYISEQFFFLIVLKVHQTDEDEDINLHPRSNV